MERVLVKTWLYSFLGILFLCIIFVHDSYHYSASGTTYIVPLRQYIFEVLRRSLSISLIVTALVGIVLVIRFLQAKWS